MAGAATTKPVTGYELSPEAEEDLWGIWQYLAQEATLVIAERIETELFESIERLARNPGLGHRRRDLTSHDIYFFAVLRYMIVYRKTNPIGILRVIHGRRHLSAVLSE